MPANPRPVTARAVLVAVALLATAAGLATGLLIGQADDPVAPAPPGEGSVDVGFARDMREHHAQAVQMSTLVREATTDPEVRTLALDILLTQQHQAGHMYGWLTAWGVPQASAGPPMQWMGAAAALGGGIDSSAAAPDHGGHPSAGPPSTSGTVMAPGMPVMPGMASDKDLQRLAQLEGLAAERLYLQLMIPHHEAGVAMATVAASEAQEPQVRPLAQSIVESQAAEITVLRQMLAARGGPVPPA